MRKALSIVLCILWMGFIFYNSANNGQTSDDRSYALLNSMRSEYHKVIKKPKVEEKSQVSSSKEKIAKADVSKREEMLNKALRKNAHAFEYFILAILVSSLLFSFNTQGKSALIYIMFICLFYAVTDEFHQIFVSGRTSSVSDVLIDFLGSFVGMVMYYGFYYKLYRIKSK